MTKTEWSLILYVWYSSLIVYETAKLQKWNKQANKQTNKQREGKLTWINYDLFFFFFFEWVCSCICVVVFAIVVGIGVFVPVNKISRF